MRCGSSRRCFRRARPSCGRCARPTAWRSWKTPSPSPICDRLEAKDTSGDGKIDIAVEAAPQAADKNTILNGLWVFAADAKRDNDALLAGRLNALALARLDAIQHGGPARNDLILVRVTHPGTEPRTLQPQLIVDTTLAFAFQPEARRVTVNDHETITASLTMTGVAAEQKSRRAIQLESLTIPAGKSASFFALYSGGGAIVVEPTTLEQALASRERAVTYWEHAPLPFGRVEVPDADIQALVDSSIRNIWQAREIQQGVPVFQVGPTCYRGLWIVDGAFLLESAAMVGAGKEARAGVEYELSQQKPSSAFEVLSPQFYKANGIVLWTCVRHSLRPAGNDRASGPNWQDRHARGEAAGPQLQGGGGPPARGHHPIAPARTRRNRHFPDRRVITHFQWLNQSSHNHSWASHTAMPGAQSQARILAPGIHEIRLLLAGYLESQNAGDPVVRRAAHLAYALHHEALSIIDGGEVAPRPRRGAGRWAGLSSSAAGALEFGMNSTPPHAVGYDDNGTFAGEARPDSP